MSARVFVFEKVRQAGDKQNRLNQHDIAMLAAVNQIQRAATNLKMLNEVLNRVDKNVTAAAKRIVKQTGRWPLRLNSRKAKGK